MQINGAKPDGTSARRTHFRFAESGEKRTQKNDGGAHLPHEPLGNFTAIRRCGVHHDRFPCPLDRTADMPQDPHGGVCVPQTGTVEQNRAFSGHRRRCQNRQCAVFRALHTQFTPKRSATLDYKFFHDTVTPFPTEIEAFPRFHRMRKGVQVCIGFRLILRRGRTKYPLYARAYRESPSFWRSLPRYAGDRGWRAAGSLPLSDVRPSNPFPQ